MLEAKNIVVWTNDDTKEVMVTGDTWRPKGGHWTDPIGAAYSQWDLMNDEQRVLLMLETVIDLGMQGYPLKQGADGVRRGEAIQSGTPIWLRKRLYEIARVFRREMGFHFVQWFYKRDDGHG